MQKARRLPVATSMTTFAAPYFWPNPDTPNHRPDVRRDGGRNPESIDYRSFQTGIDLARFSDTGFAYFLTHDETYAARAAVLLRAWFLNPETRMNPKSQLCAACPESTMDGHRHYRITGLTGVVDAVGLLAVQELVGDRSRRIENGSAIF